MNSKRQLLTDTALSLFYKNGIKSIGINEVLASSGVAKRTLYSHFESKEALVLAALLQRHHHFVAWLEGELIGSHTQPQLVELLFNALGSWFENKAPSLGLFRGCFFINTSAEFCDGQSDIVQFCRWHKAQVRELLARHLILPDDDFIDVVCLVKEGAIVSAHMGGHTAQIIAQCKLLLAQQAK